MVKIKKNPTIAAIMGLFPGLGFLYLGNVKKFLMFFGTVALALGVGLTGNSLLFIAAGGLTLVGALAAYTEAGETVRAGTIVKVDPWFALSCSFLWDGAGQLLIRKTGLGIFMSLCGFTPCLIAWVVAILKFGVNDMATVLTGEVYNITNILLIWLIFSLPIKVLTLIDSYYSTYHLYVAKSNNVK